MWWRGWRWFRGSDNSKSFTLKKLSEIFHNIESTKGKMVEPDPDLWRSKVILQSIEKILTSYCKLHENKKRELLFKLFLKAILQIDTLIFNISNVLYCCILNKCFTDFFVYAFITKNKNVLMFWQQMLKVTKKS